MYPVPCISVSPEPYTPYSRNHVPQSQNHVPSTLDSMYFHQKFDKTSGFDLGVHGFESTGTWIREYGVHSFWGIGVQGV